MAIHLLHPHFYSDVLLTMWVVRSLTPYRDLWTYLYLPAGTWT